MAKVVAGDIDEEIRFAVVMYGGISLCVYMNGIMQQLLHLVRSTARQEANAPGGEFLVRDGELAPIERVYRRLALYRTRETEKGDEDAVRCRFVVDVLSGTSAGGLNNLFLARALANEEGVEELTRLWIEEGDIALLLNDRESEDPDAALVAARPPRSLLNSDRMAQRLLAAMRSMEDGAPRNLRRSRLTRRLDLYMTATDLKGLDQSLSIASDDTITEMRHRAVFHFVHDPDDVGYFEGQFRTEEIRNDFVPRMTPFLTFVARATSSIVPAFEPIQLDDMARIHDPGKEPSDWYRSEASPLAYSPFFREFWHNAEVQRMKTPAERREKMNALRKDFAYRAFGDGGYGDNYPFGYAIDEVGRRPGDYKVDRKFLYVEPDPDLPALEAGSGGKSARPDVLQHAAAMFSVKTTETIREDIARLRERNRLLDRLASVQSAADLEGASAAVAPSDTLAHLAYLRLRATETTDELAKVFAAALGFEEGTPYAEGVRAIVKAIRVKLFEEGDEGPEAGTRRFLRLFDLGVMRRWLRFVRQRSAEGGDQTFATVPQSRERYLEIRKGLRRIPEVVRAAAELQAERADREAVRTDPNLRRSQAIVADHAGEGGREQVERFLRALGQLGPVRKEFGGKPHISLQELASLVINHPIRARTFGYREKAPDADRVEAAWRLICGVEERQPEESASAFETRLREGTKAARPCIQEVVDALAALYLPVIEPATKDLDNPESWTAFQAADRVMFPVLYGNGDAESTRIDVLRVSPLDCRTLVENPKLAKQKLAGTKLGHFSGFFRDVWRAEDILWGRLDGAERLVCSVLTEDGYARRVLILEAQLAVLRQDDLDKIVDDLRVRRKLDKVPLESRIETLRAQLLARALDRFLKWASQSCELDAEGRLRPVRENREKVGLILGLTDPDARREALLENVLQETMI